MIPETDLARIKRWAGTRIPEHVRDEIRIELDVTDRAVTIMECRPPWNPDLIGPEWTRFPVARLRYTKKRGEWTLYWRDRRLRFHRYDLVDPTPNIEELLAEVDGDRTGIFWG